MNPSRLHPLRSAGVACSLAVIAASACSSDIDLVSTGQLNPFMGGSGGSIVDIANGGTGGTPSSTGGTGGGGGGGGTGEPNPPGPLQQGGTGGAINAGDTGDAGPMGCIDTDRDGTCDVDDLCPLDADPSTTDSDQDGRPDVCDPCPNLANQDDAADVDQDGIPDVCDTCGIGVALALRPMFYFPLDEDQFIGAAANLGSVAQQGTYTGPVTRALRGVADPNGRAVRMGGQQAGQFSRVTALNVVEFPTTALTAMFWVRTTQTTDYSIISYATADSQNEFGIIVEGDVIRITLNNSTFETGNILASDMADGAWHFIAITWETTVANVYFDGVLAGAPVQTAAGFEVVGGSGQPVTGPLSLRPGGVLILGQDQDGLNTGFMATQALTGGLDEVAIYDRALSNAEIQELMRATTCGESCDGRDNDGDGRVDEGFLGSAPGCPAASCQAILDAGEAFGTGSYFLTTNPTVASTCAF
jgi:concanavalin A-like lectin/glucanase superfamily protein